MAALDPRSEWLAAIIAARDELSSHLVELGLYVEFATETKCRSRKVGALRELVQCCAYVIDLDIDYILECELPPPQSCALREIQTLFNPVAHRDTEISTFLQAIRRAVSIPQWEQLFSFEHQRWLAERRWLNLSSEFSLLDVRVTQYSRTPGSFVYAIRHHEALAACRDSLLRAGHELREFRRPHVFVRPEHFGLVMEHLRYRDVVFSDGTSLAWGDLHSSTVIACAEFVGDLDDAIRTCRSRVNVQLKRSGFLHIVVRLGIGSVALSVEAEPENDGCTCSLRSL